MGVWLLAAWREPSALIAFSRRLFTSEPAFNLLPPSDLGRGVLLDKSAWIGVNDDPILEIGEMEKTSCKWKWFGLKCGKQPIRHTVFLWLQSCILWNHFSWTSPCTIEIHPKSCFPDEVWWRMSPRHPEASATQQSSDDADAFITCKIVRCPSHDELRCFRHSPKSYHVHILFYHM